MLRHLALFNLLLWIAFPSLQAAGVPRQVLLIHSFGRDFSPYAEVAGAFRSELRELSPNPVEVREVSLEMARLDGAESDQPLLDFLNAVYQDGPPALLVPVGTQAAMFCERHRGALFPKVPLLMLSADRQRLPGFEGAPGIASVGLDVDVDGYIQNILDVLPDTQDVYVVAGTAPLDRAWEEDFRSGWGDFESRVSFHWLTGQSVKEMAETFRNLPRRSAVFVGLLNRDAAGVPYETIPLLHALGKDANAPIFGFIPTQLGHGIVGGRLAPMPLVGEIGAECAVRILAGEVPEAIAPVALGLGAPVYDSRELKRWKISTKHLPADATVLFREPTLWESHRVGVLITLGFTVVQSVLIAGLLAARRRSRETAASLSLAADAAKVGLWQRGSHSDRFTASPRWRKIFGLPSAGPLPISLIAERLHPEDRYRVREAIEEAASKGNGFSLEHRVVHPDGSVHWVSSHGRSFKDGNGHGYWTRGASIDITDRHMAEVTADLQRQELAHLSRVSSLGVLSGALAHELNQPLGIILSNAQAAEFLLKSESPDLNELREILADIVREDRRAGDVIRRLRALLRRGETSPRLLDVNENVHEVLRLMKSDLVGRMVSVDLRLAPAVPQVHMDRVQLQQVLLNLILNACDAMAGNEPKHRVVTIETRAENEVCISVRDRGTGLPEDPARLFEPFQTTKEQGLGMGLAICRTLTEAHGGRLWAESNPGGGAVFHVALPLTET